ncbi:MAG: PRC-barrel domain-containing protein [Clostridia bacterium]|nr:PRC-barrel domain-containing protein [Clostridia bacterium]
MIVNYCALKKKTVVNVLDGRKLGVVKDIIFTFPEGVVTAFIVADGNPFSSKEPLEVKLCCVNKIGDDAVLVSLSERPQPLDEE